jgi:hypothetical protein
MVEAVETCGAAACGVVAAPAAGATIMVIAAAANEAAKVFFPMPIRCPFVRSRRRLRCGDCSSGSPERAGSFIAFAGESDKGVVIGDSRHQLHFQKTQ